MQKFSNLYKLLRVTAYVFRFVKNSRSEEKTVGHLSTEELSSVMDYWIKLSQFQCFSNEINCIKCNKCIDKSSKFYGLNPKIDEKGTEISAPLPPDRVEKSQPFEVSGIEFAGPLILRDGSKVYIALFTCTVTRGAPWWGGFWERLVRSVKTCLKRILGKSSLTYEELYTVLVEIEAVINSRPITYLYSNVNEPDPLSPSHFLTGSKLTVLPSPNTVPKSSKCDLIKRWKHRLLLLDHFWKRFYKEYLLELRTAMFSKIPKNSGQFKINDVVLIKEDNIKRCNWKLGRIKTLFPGRDGKIRSCEIHVANGTLSRPIERLYNLEIQD
ncbi:hypothetical protein AVEN_206443-1 [Araneus ventricosus]|uniref:DUF5641 domain-containing protein n=1 Tax=Araneus ventricosus TaxID=182803 RepID=A0A4Y2SWD5_ARAVE|nr:hypothetical protein AVEN_206443-1 [Araneus ventricosus]